jgi:hypothetical protein
MKWPRVQLTLRTLLVATAIGAALFTLETRPRDEFVLVTLIAAGILILFNSRPETRVRSSRQAIRIATAHLRKVDATFRPEKHLARAYTQFGLVLWTVDFYPADGVYVVTRVRITSRGNIHGLASFGEDEQITSLKKSLPIFILDRDGAVLEASFQSELHDVKFNRF